MKTINKVGILLLVFAIMICIEYGGFPGDGELLAEIVFVIFFVSGGYCLIAP